MSELYEVGSGSAMMLYKETMTYVYAKDMNYVGKLQYQGTFYVYVGNTAKTHTDVAIIKIGKPGYKFETGMRFKYSKFKPHYSNVLKLMDLMKDKVEIFVGATSL